VLGPISLPLVSSYAALHRQASLFDELGVDAPTQQEMIRSAVKAKMIDDR
jgi:hypothetical protein